MLMHTINTTNLQYLFIYECQTNKDIMVLLAEQIVSKIWVALTDELTLALHTHYKKTLLSFLTVVLCSPETIT